MRLNGRSSAGMRRAATTIVGVVVVLILASACGPSSDSEGGTGPRTAARLAAARTGLERAIELGDKSMVKNYLSESCEPGRRGRLFSVAYAVGLPLGYRPHIKIATRNVANGRGEVIIRMHWSEYGDTSRIVGDWEPWRYEHGRWRLDCIRKPKPSH